jgi:flagellar biosynthetic protein FliP
MSLPRCAVLWLGGTVMLAMSALAWAAAQPDIALPGVQIRLGGAAEQNLAPALRILLVLTVLSLAPSILIAVTAFTRIVIVLAMLRHAFGMQDTPPNAVLISLALFLTLFTMMPVLDVVNERAFAPYSAGKITTDAALKEAIPPIREFMLRQTREKDLALMVEIAGAPTPKVAEDVSLVHLIPAFMLSELRTAFEIGFMIFLPFLLVDLIISTLLMAMGMLMVPPIMISLPLKILMFVLIDGWNLVTRALVTSFH